MKSSRRNDHRKGRISFGLLGKWLLFSYILTVGLLLLLALLFYRLDLSVKAISIAVIGIYVAASLLAGLMVGKKIGSRKFLWGLLMGSAYFVILAVISILMNHSAKGLVDNFLTVYVICAGSGMLGGMLG